ncbi:adhesion G-protein coupled receptor G6-like [Antedon mediterranea]|uniref:adhesion G-protein coupled receptor G6-like n=1 Tax=Antedon mediterranea TaxID=105859 RepID=UPI003AF7E39D
MLTTAPQTLECPGDISTNTSSPVWVVPITNTVQLVDCTNEPGDSYPIGSVTQVTCSATGEAGQTDSCTFYITIETDLSVKINDLTKDVNEENVEEVAVELEEIVATVEDSGGLQPADVQQVSVALETIADIESPNEIVTDAVVGIVDAVLGTSESSDTELTPETTSVILESFEQQISTAASDGQNYTQNQETLSVQTLSFDSDNIRNNVVFVVQEEKKTTEICLYSGCEVFDQSTITLPRNLVSNDQRSNVSFTSYYNSNLFQSSRNITLSKVILSATVYDDNLPHVFEEPITIVFHIIKEDYENATCVFWDTTLNGFGDWSKEGCTRVNVDDESSITCQCTHLTNFAVLFFPNELPEESGVLLDILTYAGCGLSILCLLITIAIIISTKSLRKLQPQKIMLNLCASLTCLYITFICGIDTATPGTVPCIAIAVLLHYFLLASIAWTAVEAANMYLYFVKVVRAKTSNILLRSMIFAWGIPLIPPIVLMSVDRMSFYENKDYCYVNTHDSNVFIYAVVIPIAFAMACNCIIYMLVLNSLYCSRSKVLGNKYSTLEEKKNRISNAIALSFLLGLTWVFGFLCFDKNDASLVFLILFCVFNSLQGVAIFYLFIFRQRKTRKDKKHNFKRGLKRNVSGKKAINTANSDSTIELAISTTEFNTK